MRRIKALLIAALALAAFTSIAATADAALPSLLQLSTVTSGTLEATSKTAATRFFGIVNITGSGYTFALKSDFEMTGSGSATLFFTNAVLGTKKCKANGDTAGNVLVPGEWHTVLAASGGAERLFLILFLVVPTLTVECEGINIIVTGNQLVNAEPFGEEVTEIDAETGKCAGNTPAFVNYLNDAGASTAANLKSETGGVKSNSCQEVVSSLKYKTSGMGAEVMEP